MATTTRSRGRIATATRPDQQRLASLARTLQVTQRNLQVSEPKELTLTQRGKLLAASAGLVRVGLTLSPSYPRQGDSALDFMSPMMVQCGEVSWSGASKPKTGLALFSSKYWQVSQPSVQVEFDLIEAGKKHLVELYLTCIQSSGSYQFRILPGPTGQTKDISFGGGTTVITEVIDPAPSYTGPYYVTFMQLNPKSQLMSWYFHKLVVTVAG
jgi:hypothetical protein